MVDYKTINFKISNSEKKLKKIKGVYGFGKAKGEVGFLKPVLELKDLTPKPQAAIIACHKLASKGVIFKAGCLGIQALIINLIDKDWQDELKAISQEIGLCLLVLADKEIEEKLIESLDKKKVVCDGDKMELIII